MRLLIIDDDEAMATVFLPAFKRAGFSTVEAHTGGDGLAKAKTGGFNLILLGEVLADISGNEVLESLKKHQSTKNIPVLILSNFSQQELVDKALKLGAVEYIFKYRIEPAELIEKIKRIAKK